MADKNYYSIANNPEVGGIVISTLEPPKEYGEWNDTLKLSNSQNGDIHVTSVKGGSEDCVDVNNRCQYLKIYVAELYSGGQYVATIKGGCDNIWLSGTIYTHGNVVDVDLDNYSDQSHKRCSNISLNLRTLDGSAVKWRSLMGCKPHIGNPEQRYECVLYVPWFFGVIWNRFYQLLKILRITA